MSTQLPLFNHLEEARRLRRAILVAVRSVVQRIGPKVIAPELDLSPSALMDAIEERERHGLSLRQVSLILAYDDRSETLSALADATGHEPPVRKPQLDDTAKLERLLRSCAKAGPAGRAIVEDADIIPGGRP